MQQYITNFFVWWYGVKVRQMFKSTLQWFIFVLEYSNTLTMAKYITVPMFQDSSSIGRVVSFVIRGIWVWIGGMMSVVISLPIWIFLVIYAALPVLSIFMVLVGLFRLI